MAKRVSTKHSENESALHSGQSGETHQTTTDGESLTTNQGTPISDNQNSLKAGARGPSLLEDFVLREKITHFDTSASPSESCTPAGPVRMAIFNRRNRYRI
jgi:Catalase